MRWLVKLLGSKWPHRAAMGSDAARSSPWLKRWRSLQLAQQFTLGSAIVLIGGMAVVGWWVSDRISRDVTDNTAQAAALYMAGTVSPLIQELGDSDRLAPATIQRLDELLEQSPIREQILSMKVWNLNGTIVYSKWKDMIGKSFPDLDNFMSARAGRVAAEFGSEPHEEDSHEQEAGHPLLEIYAPIRAKDSLHVIAVAEFYINGDKLTADLWEAVILSWLLVASVTLLMLAALSGIVYRGSHTIERQRAQLTEQVGALQKLLGQNEDLRSRLQQSNLRIADINERLLQRIGADLHDGPAQLLSYALLRLNRFIPIIREAAGSKAPEEVGRMRAALTDTLTEVRNISTGLSLPRLNAADLRETIQLAVTLHEDHTGSKVDCELGDLPTVTSHPLKVCIYRFIQEALANAYRHAGGVGQRVIATSGHELCITVCDAGPGFAIDESNTSGLGLTGMRARVEAVGGTLRVEPQASPGARLTATFSLQSLRESDTDA